MATGLARLDAKGWIHEHGADYIRAAVECFVQRTTEYEPANKTVLNVIAVAPSHAEINAFTSELRVKLEEIGALLRGRSCLTTRQPRSGEQTRRPKRVTHYSDVGR